MTRKKKSRKSGQIGVRKLDIRPETKSPSTRKKKAPKGQKSGSRNSLLEENSALLTDSEGSIKKDPKLGSKKKIELVKSKIVEEPKEAKPQINKTPDVKLTKVAPPQISPEQEFEALENNETLIDLAERVEAGEVLTGKEAKFFNKNMARYDELYELLEIEDEDDDTDPLNSDQWDDLLDK